MGKYKIAINKFWATLKGKIILIVAAVAGLAAFIANIKTIGESILPLFDSNVDVKGTVINSDNNPAENARILMLLYGKNRTDSLNTFSGKEGIFLFENITEIKFDSVEINVFWKDKTAFYKSKFDDSFLQKALTIQLPNKINVARANPLSFAFYNLKGSSLDFLLEGKIEPSWEENLSKNPFIIQNDVFKVLDTIRKKFHYPSEEVPTQKDLESGDFSQPIKYLKRNNKEKPVLLKKTPKYYTVGTHDYTDEPSPIIPSLPPYVSEVSFEIKENDLKHFINEGLKNKLKTHLGASHSWFLTKSQLLKLKDLELKKNINLQKEYGEDFGDIPTNQLVEFLIFITQQHYPDDFIRAKISFGRYCGDASWIIDIIPPSLSLKIVLIENKSSDFLSLGSFFLRKNDITTLRKENANLDSTYELINVEYPSIGRLKPNETIVLPLKLALTTARKQEYTFGPSLSIESIDVNNDIYAVRKESTQNLVIKNGPRESGSCPYVYTFSKSEKIWLLEDHILYGYDAKEKENEHMLPLKRFYGQIQIRENDPETSYIDYLYIKHVLPDGKIKILRPKNISLNKKDGNYLILNRGDKVLLNFPKKDVKLGTYSVISYGYYLRYK